MKKLFLILMLALTVTSCIVVEDGYRGTRVRVRRPPLIIIDWEKTGFFYTGLKIYPNIKSLFYYG